MKVLVSSYACNPEGNRNLHPGEDLTGWKLVQQLSRYCELWVIAHKYNQKVIEAAPASATRANIHFIFLALPSWISWIYKIEFAQRIYYYLWQISAWRLAKELNKRIPFDIAHHVTFGNYWIGSFIGAFLPVPFVWGPVGGGQRTPQELLKEYSLYGKFAEWFRGFAQWVGINLLLSRRLCLRRSKAVLVCNYETRNKIPDKYSSKVHMLPVNGISSEDLLVSGEPRRSSDKFKIVSSGRFVRLKGFALAIRAFSIMVEKAPNAIFEIIGSGPEEGRLKALAKSLDIEDRVQFVGWLPRDDVLRNMRFSDLFLFPSFRDGGGAVVVEAMASGLPVVVLDSGGPGFYIEDQWGIKVQPSDPEETVRAMANALYELYNDTPRRIQMGLAARARAEAYFLWDRIGEEIIALYNEILAK